MANCGGHDPLQTIASPIGHQLAEELFRNFAPFQPAKSRNPYGNAFRSPRETTTDLGPAQKEREKLSKQLQVWVLFRALRDMSLRFLRSNLASKNNRPHGQNQKSTMKTVKIDNSSAIKSATAAIRAAGLVALTSVTAARATLAIVIRDQVAALVKAGVTSKVISSTVREALTGLAKPNTINKALIRAGVRLRGKRNDAAALHSADGLIGLSLKPAKPAAEGAEGDEGEGDEGEGDEGEGDEGGDETAGSGHTVATLAALLASLPESLVNEAVTASQARRLIRAA